MSRFQKELKALAAKVQSTDQNSQIIGLRRIVLYMTQGTDMSKLFPDVLKLITSENIEIKKLTYLYLVEYSRHNPELSILIVNTFIKDSEQSDPLIRGLAVRAMSSIKVKDVVESFAQPIKRCLKDKDPYVRKISCIAVLKLFDISPELVIDYGMIQDLNDLLSDTNANVVCNALYALKSISDASTTPILEVSSKLVGKVIFAIKEANEWGKIQILDFLIGYTPKKPKTAKKIIEVILPLLSHKNTSIVLSCIRIIINYGNVMEYRNEIFPSILTLLTSSHHEVSYIVLREIKLIIAAYGDIFERVEAFFCRYNEPIYNKLEKLDILVSLSSEGNVTKILRELKVYGMDVEPLFVKRTIISISKIAIKLPTAAAKCVETLMELADETKSNYAVQEIVVAIRDIFRKYPGKFESAISRVSEKIRELDNPMAKEAMVWIIGEYTNQIDNADLLLEYFVDGFLDEPGMVQLAILTAVVKVYLRDPDKVEELLERVLTLSTEKVEFPDLRDRAYFYWRLLTEKEGLGHATVFGKKPEISLRDISIDPALLGQLLKEIPLISSVLHVPEDDLVDEDKVEIELEESDEVEESTSAEEGGAVSKNASGALVDLGEEAPVGAAKNTDDLLDELFGFVTEKPKTVASDDPRMKNLLTNSVLSVDGFFYMDGDSPLYLKMKVLNKSSDAVSTLRLAFNSNLWGMQPKTTLVYSGAGIAPGTAAVVDVEVVFNVVEKMTGWKRGSPETLQAALKTDRDVFYFMVKFDPSVLFSDKPVQKEEFMSKWREISREKERVYDLVVTKRMNFFKAGMPITSVNVPTRGTIDDLRYFEREFKKKKIHLVGRRKKTEGPIEVIVEYYAVRMHDGDVALFELSLSSDQKAKLYARNGTKVLGLGEYMVELCGWLL